MLQTVSNPFLTDVSIGVSEIINNLPVSQIMSGFEFAFNSNSVEDEAVNIVFDRLCNIQGKAQSAFTFQVMFCTKGTARAVHVA